VFVLPYDHSRGVLFLCGFWQPPVTQALTYDPCHIIAREFKQQSTPGSIVRLHMTYPPIHWRVGLKMCNTRICMCYMRAGGNTFGPPIVLTVIHDPTFVNGVRVVLILVLVLVLKQF
jgi:hypothetical protein